jgi:hypothetical protein
MSLQMNQDFYTLTSHNDDINFSHISDDDSCHSTGTNDEPDTTTPHLDLDQNTVIIASDYKKFKTALENINFSNLYNENTKTKIQFGQFVFNILQIFNKQNYTTDTILNIINMLQPVASAENDSIEYFIDKLTKFLQLIGKNKNLGKSKITLGLLFNLIHRPEAQIERDDDNENDIPLLISSLDMTQFDHPSRMKYKINITVYDLYGETCNPVNILKRIKHHYYTINSAKMIIMKYTSEEFISFLQASKGEICTDNIFETAPRQTQYDKKIDFTIRRQLRVKNIISNCCKMSFYAESYISFKTLTSSSEQQNPNDYWPIFLKFQHDNKRKFDL